MYTPADVPENVPLDIDVVLGEVNALLHVIRLGHRVDVDQVDLNHTERKVERLFSFYFPVKDGPILIATAGKLEIGQERGTRDKPSQ